MDRLHVLQQHLNPELKHQEQEEEDQQVVSMNSTAATSSNKSSFTVTDNRSGKSIEVPVLFEGKAIRATDFSKLGVNVFDPGYMNTAVVRSRITYIDGDNGILRYRGYNIEELCANCNFLEVAYLLVNGELPTKNQFDYWNDRIMKHTYLHQNLLDLLKTFRYDAQFCSSHYFFFLQSIYMFYYFSPMGMVISTVAALSTFYPEANPSLSGDDLYKSEQARNKQIFRILGKLPTIAACAYRHRIGKPYNNPESSLTYTENFLYMLDRLNEVQYKPNPILAKALDKLFIIHADHELNCSTAAMRHLSSSGVDPYSAVSGAAAALYGPLHGGACEAVLRMLESIKTKENIPKFIEEVKQKKKILFGFGHRIYKSYDPRAKIAKKLADEVFQVLGKEPLIEIAVELERIALNDEYFKERKLYPNVDFYTGVIYRTLGFPTDMFPVLFAIPRTAGWLAHWVESLDDEDTRIYRPRQVYLGHDVRPFEKMEQRKQKKTRDLDSTVSTTSRRRDIKT